MNFAPKNRMLKRLSPAKLDLLAFRRPDTVAGTHLLWGALAGAIVREGNL